MKFRKRAMDLKDKPDLMYRYTANKKNHVFHIDYYVIERTVQIELNIYADNELVYTSKNHREVSQAEEAAHLYAKNNNFMYTRKPVEERDIKSLYLEKNRKIESIKIKVNSLLESYPEEKAIRKLRSYLEDVL
jgi:hypothetical protein